MSKLLGTNSGATATISIHPNNENTHYVTGGYTADQTGVATQVGLSVVDWLGSSTAKAAVYDSTGALVSTADFSSAQGTGVIFATLSSSISLTSGVSVYYILVQSDAYLTVDVTGLSDKSDVAAWNSQTPPSTIAVPGNNATFNGFILVWLDGTIGGGAAALAMDQKASSSMSGSLSSGPVLSGNLIASNVSNTGFDILSTWNKNCTVKLVKKATQPSDAEFDASTESTSATADVQSTVHHTGQ